MQETAQEFIFRKKEEISKQIKMKDIGRKTNRKYIIESASYLVANNLKEKVFCFERLVLTDDHYDKEDVGYPVGRKGDIEYRIGYYIVGKNGNKNNKWTWGQFTPMISKTDLDELLTLAKKEKTYI